MKKVLFIDRDGTIIVEPPEDFQIDSLEKLEFIPGAISALAKIQKEGEYEFVMVTNQDGLGTDSFPEDTFWPAHNKMLKTLEGEGVVFKEILIDKTLPEENAATRKPRTGLLTNYMNSKYDLSNSYVIGDRVTDIELAKNLSAKAIYFNPEEHEDAVCSTTSWEEVAEYLLNDSRTSIIRRATKETQIVLGLNLDGSGQIKIDTGIGFFDHMLELFAFHSGVDLDLSVNGDLKVDEHHTVEDTALALGQAFSEALGSKKGIERYGFLLPMDESLAQVAIDFSGRPQLVWEAEFKREKVGEMPTEMFQHFFKSFSDAAKCNLNIKVEGDNEHHMIEAVFKAVAKSIKQAIQQSSQHLPSTKGVL